MQTPSPLVVHLQFMLKSVEASYRISDFRILGHAPCQLDSSLRTI
jgi:hypothetical protein